MLTVMIQDVDRWLLAYNTHDNDKQQLCSPLSPLLTTTQETDFLKTRRPTVTWLLGREGRGGFIPLQRNYLVMQLQ